MNLYTSYYNDHNPERQKELEFALMMNIENALIEKIYLLAENDPVQKSEKIVVINHGRPTYNDFFRLINEVSSEEAVNVIANSDICFDNTLSEVKKHIDTKKCFALSRYDLVKGQLIPHHSRDSQDAWIFKGKVGNISGDFCLGKPGCDNKIAYEINKSGYSISNPCKLIHAIHVHETGVRNYTRSKDLVPPPYLMVQPI